MGCADSERSAGVGVADGGLAAVGSWGQQVPAREVEPGHSSCPHPPPYWEPGIGGTHPREPASATGRTPLMGGLASQHSPGGQAMEEGGCLSYC